MNAPAAVAELTARLGQPTPHQLDDATYYTKPDDTAFYFVENPAPSAEAGEDQRATVSRFAFGDTPRIREVVEADGLNVLSGPMKNLVEQSDADRHFSLLFLRPALFNERGQLLMSGQMSDFNRQLDLFLQDEIRGAMVSFFVDDANYFEFMIDQTLDLKSEDLATSLKERLRTVRDEIPKLLTKLPTNQYWDNVRLRYDNMLADVYRNLRWDVEFGTVIGNCWLPPMAAHNLIAASELVTAFSSGSPDVASTATAKPSPGSLEELLNLRRSLDVTTNPDLNVLLTGIRDEIIEEYGMLPFKFEIRMIGNDLQKEGITQNQRPGDFKLIDKTLAEILTEIMVRCNPDKGITGPADPNCKLVWVLGPSPADPAQQSILITTRAGASEKNLELPPVFQVK